MKLLVAGSRGFRATHLIAKYLDHYGLTLPRVIVSGMAHGPDLIGREWAIRRGIPVMEFPADWKTHGRRAGVIRNNQMADVADELIAFWDGRSNGTRQMIQQMKRLGKPVTIIHDP